MVQPVGGSLKITDDNPKLLKHDCDPFFNKSPDDFKDNTIKVEEKELTPEEIQQEKLDLLLKQIQYICNKHIMYVEVKMEEGWNKKYSGIEGTDPRRSSNNTYTFTIKVNGGAKETNYLI
jgi:hypothetical protein